MWARLPPRQNVSLFLSGGSSSLVFPLPHLLHSQSALSFALSVTLVYLTHSTPTLFALFFFHFSFIWVHIPLLLHSKFSLNDSKCLGPVPLQSCQHSHHIHITTPTKSCTSACTVVLQDRVNKLNNHSKTHFVPNRFEVCTLIIDERWQIQIYSERKNRRCFHLSLCLVDVLCWVAPLVTTETKNLARVVKSCKISPSLNKLWNECESPIVDFRWLQKMMTSNAWKLEGRRGKGFQNCSTILHILIFFKQQSIKIIPFSKSKKVNVG